MGDEIREEFQEKMTDLLKYLGDPESGANGDEIAESLPANMRAVKEYLFEDGAKPVFVTRGDARVKINKADETLEAIKDIISNNHEFNFEEEFEDIVEDIMEDGEDDEDDYENSNQDGGARKRRRSAHRKSHRKSRRSAHRKSRRSAHRKSRKTRRVRKLTRRHKRHTRK